jgi:hypothetical protein
MPDPSLLPDGALEVGKLGGSAVGGGVITFLMARIFGSQDKALEQVMVRLDALQASVAGLSQQLAVLGSGTSRRDADVSRLESTVAEQGKAIARLEAKLEQISEGVLR